MINIFHVLARETRRSIQSIDFFTVNEKDMVIISSKLLDIEKQSNEIVNDFRKAVESITNRLSR